MYVNIIIYSNKLLLFVWSTLNKEKKKKQHYFSKKSFLSSYLDNARERQSAMK